MEERTKVLYVSYDGMTDSLGQSQVIPYLVELVKKGFEIHILSAEKSEVFSKRKVFISQLLQNNGIIWHPINYTKKPPVLSTIKDVFALKKQAKELQKTYNFKIVHCRSYIAAFVGLYLQKNSKVKFLFDMRGFYADERVDGNLWPKSNPVFYAVYKFFKRKEKKFLSRADYTVSLTYAGRDIIHKFDKMTDIPIEVIPCCADLDLFDYHKTDKNLIEKFRQELNISESDFVICYLGSIGTWYMLDEMMHFFQVLKRKYANAKFLFITKDNSDEIYTSAQKYNIINSDILIRPANREEVPALISICKTSIFFIKPVFSKKASSPTKLAELLGMGIPVICNSNVGDIDKFVPENNLGIMIENLDEPGFENAVEQIEELQKISPEHLRNVAQNLFSLEIGAKRYYDIYKKLIK
jgi:glycosyltransferase involved in cell wall biosynthesis